MEKVETLLAKIEKANELYRKGEPIMSDADYDKMVERLRQISPQNEWFNHIEPSPVPSNRKVKLPLPMKSLNKVKTTVELERWLKNIGINGDDALIIMPKFDGLSLLHDERTDLAYSRGGAENEGQDCTAHARMARISSSARKSDFTYGEFVFSVESWERHFKGQMSEETGLPYKSPRNTAAGLLNRDEPSPLLKDADFYRYGMEETALDNFMTFEDVLLYLCQEFNQRLLYMRMAAERLQEEDLRSLFNMWRRIYYIDGLVIYANDLGIWKKVGRQDTTGNPNYAMAYKNPSFTAAFTTKVRKINWSITKSGALKPTVSIDAVDFGDCEIDNPTGYNARYIFDNHIGEGATITITRSGGVNPKILDVLSPAEPQAMDAVSAQVAKCPYCGNPTRWNDTKVEICCTNDECKGRNLAKIIFFYSTLDVENMGAETIGKMYDNGFTTLRLMLDANMEELASIDGFGGIMATNIVAENERIKQGIVLPLLMHASDCFNGIGQVKAKRILDGLSPLEIQQVIDGTYKVGDISSKTMQAFANGIKPFHDFIVENGLKVLITEKPQVSGKYANMKVCFSGIRDKAVERQILDGGGEICSSVSKKTTHLVVADVNATSTKIAKARQYGVAIVNMDDFMGILQ